MSQLIETAESELLRRAGGDPERAALLLEAIDQQRRQTSFVRYWQPQGDQKQLWDRLNPSHRIWLICGGNGCLAEGTQVATPHGPQPIEKLDTGDLVYAGDGSIVPVLHRFDNGEKDVWRWHGKKRQRDIYLDATIDHQVVYATHKDNTPRLHRLHEAGTRSYLALADGISFGEQKQPMALLIGTLLGDGYIAGRELQWTCAEPDLVEELRGYIEGFGIRLVTRGIQHYLRSASPYQRGNTVRAELARLGLNHCLSGDKFIPPEVWNWTKADIAHLLAGLIATGGSVFRSGSSWHCSFVSSSLALIEGFSRLASQGFGIYGSTICKGSKGTWSVSYSNKQALERLAEIPIPGRKGRLLKAIVFDGKHSKGTLIPLADRERLGTVPTHDLLINHPSHIFQLQNGTQVANSGKTDLSCALQTAWLLGKDYFKGYPAEEWVNALPIPDRPVSVRAVGLNSDMLKDPIFEKLTGTTDHPSFFPQDNSIEHINNQSFTVRFRNGSKWQGKSADVDPKTHGGPTIDLNCLDEECSYAIYQENYQRIRKGGYLVITATPLDDVGTVSHPWIFDLIQQAEAGDDEILALFMSSLNNPFLDNDYKRKQITKWKGHPEESARLYGRPVRRSGLFYSMWKAERPLWVPAFDLPRKMYRVLMIDPASTGPVGALWAAFDDHGNMVLYRCYKEKGLTVSQHVQNILAENRGDSLDLLLMDPFMGRQRVPSGGEEHKQVIQVWRDAGLPRLRLADVDYPQALEKSREYMLAAFDEMAAHPSVIIFDHLTQLKDELDRYIVDSVVQGVHKGETKDRPRKGNSDLIECYQYLAGMNLKFRDAIKVKLVPPEYR